MKRYLMLVSVVLGLLMIASTTHAQSGSGFNLAWFTIDGGGGTSSSSGYTLAGTIGQSDVGVSISAGYTLSGGFWFSSNVTVGSYQVYLPLVIK